MRQTDGRAIPRVWARIDLDQDFEVRYWARKLGVEEPRLRDAVRDVGPIVEKVRQRLQEQGHAA